MAAVLEGPAGRVMVAGRADPSSVGRLPYEEVWCLDFEFRAPDGERPEPLCMVAREIRSGRELRLWRDRLELGRPPLAAPVKEV